MNLLPHQIVARDFLAQRKYAILADDPRVGKTGATIRAADEAMVGSVLVVTTASGRPVWQRAFPAWSYVGLPVDVVQGTTVTPERVAKAHRMIVGWGSIAKLAPLLSSRRWGLLVLDEMQYGKTPSAARTEGAYIGAAPACDRVWMLSGTAIPNRAIDIWTAIASTERERLTTAYGPTDVTSFEDFRERYCKFYAHRPNRWAEPRIIITGGKNEEELHQRIKGFYLRRTQADVGIVEPVYELLPIEITAAQRAAIEAEFGAATIDVVDAAETGTTADLDENAAIVRRLTGMAKAKGVARAVMDEAYGNDTKFVVMAWHRDVLDALGDALKSLGVVRVDGATTDKKRDTAQQEFQSNGGPRVFLGQISACGEAIDLSTGNELIFAESSHTPKDMRQAALRVTNLMKREVPRVRVAALAGSIDEKMQQSLLEKFASINKVLK